MFVVSLCLILGGFMASNQQLTARIIHWITKINTPVSFIVVGGGLVTFLVSLYLMGKARENPESSSTFTFETEKGPINISLRAIEDYIVKHFSEEPVVNNIRVRVGTSRDRRNLRVHATISVWSEQNLRTAGETVQQEITRCLKEGLGLDNVETVRVSENKIIKTKASKSAPATPSADEIE